MKRTKMIIVLIMGLLIFFGPMTSVYAKEYTPIYPTDQGMSGIIGGDQIKFSDATIWANLTARWGVRVIFRDSNEWDNVELKNELLLVTDEEKANTTTPSNPSHDGYRFVGWERIDNSGGTSTLNNDGTVTNINGPGPIIYRAKYDEVGEVVLTITNTVNGVSNYDTTDYAVLTYNVIVKNTGESISTNNRIVTIVPEGLEVDTSTINYDGTYMTADNTIVWNLPSINPNETYTLIYEAKIPDSNADPQQYIGSSHVTSDEITQEIGSGNTVVNFSITNDSSNDPTNNGTTNNPQTGDNITKYSIILLISVIGFIICFCLIRKNNKLAKGSIMIILCIISIMCLSKSYADPDNYVYGQYDMTYLPGTTDSVNNMPENEMALTPGIDNPYVVSSVIPQREGFEFIDWSLKWGVVTSSYTVKYKALVDEREIVPSVTNSDIEIGTTVIENAISIDGWEVYSENSKSIVISSGENIIEFVYKYALPVEYEVHYVDQASGEEIAPTKHVYDGVYGEWVEEYPIEIEGYYSWSDVDGIYLKDTDNHLTLFYDTIPPLPGD